jgi:hypothetical protein
MSEDNRCGGVYVKHYLPCPKEAENTALRERVKRMETALQRVAKEKFPHPTPCRETYLRKIAQAALKEGE